MTATKSGIQAVHATAVTLASGSILLRGPSGAGKSDTALRLLDRGACLIADDQVCLQKTSDGRLTASAPPSLSGLIEVRGVGLVAVKPAPSAPIDLIIDLVSADAVPRLPDPSWDTLQGVTLPTLSLHAFHASTPLKIDRALEALILASPDTGLSDTNMRAGHERSG